MAKETYKKAQERLLEEGAASGYLVQRRGRTGALLKHPRITVDGHVYEFHPQSVYCLDSGSSSWIGDIRGMPFSVFRGALFCNEAALQNKLDRIE